MVKSVHFNKKNRLDLKLFNCVRSLVSHSLLIAPTVSVTRAPWSFRLPWLDIMHVHG